MFDVIPIYRYYWLDNTIMAQQLIDITGTIDFFGGIV